MTVLDEILGENAPPATWPDLLPDHLSPSSLKAYMRCRESFRRKYVLRQQEASSHYFIWGGAHNTALVDINYAQKILSGTDMPVAEVQEAFAAAVDLKAEAAGGDREIEWGKEMTRSKIKDQGVELVAAYMHVAAPKVQPTAVEKRFDINVAGLPVPMVGYLDVVTDTSIVELKTASAKGVQLTDRFQGRVYQLAMPLPVEFHIATKTKMPAIYTGVDGDDYGIPAQPGLLETTRRMVVNLAADIAATFEQFGPDETWPGAYTAKGTCNLCSFKATCPWWAQ